MDDNKRRIAGLGFTGRWDDSQSLSTESGGVPRLCQLLQSPDLSVQRLASCALCNICANHDQNKRLAREANALPCKISLSRDDGSESVSSRPRTADEELQGC